MCGRIYKTFTSEELLYRYLNNQPVALPEMKPNYNMVPTQETLVLRAADAERRFDSMRWGLVPIWANDVKSANRYSVINAKAEEITEKRSFKGAFERRRCIVPVTGFFEWQKADDGRKKPYCVHLKDEPIMSLAGIWEHWQSKDGLQELFSYAIITTGANEIMREIHMRMPVILERSGEAEWLNPENTDATALRKMLKPCPPEWLEVYPVATLVNSPRNNRLELLQPA